MRSARKKPKQPLDHEPAAVVYARENAGLTRTALAEQCGVSLSLISEIERGNRNATPAMLNKLANALNCPRVILERKREPEATEVADVEVHAVREAERAVPDGVHPVRSAPAVGGS